ncbi:MAG: hypothetical protein ACI4G0_01605 [Ruminococcus sp.]
MFTFNQIIIALSLSIGISALFYSLTNSMIICLLSFFISLVLYYSVYRTISYISKNSINVANKIIFYISRVPKIKYVINQKEVEYKYIDMEHLIFRRKYNLSVKSKTLDHFDEEFKWTGISNSNNIVSINVDEEITNIINEFTWTKYTINFNKTYMKSENITTGSVIDLYDSNHTAQTFYSNTIKEKIQLLTITIKIPSELNPQNGVFIVRNKYKEKIVSENLEYNPTIGGYKYCIPYPRIGFNYIIQWSFN